jgi:prepilin-type N-terminal cleavage/methylation domain-containing protein
MRSRAAGFTLLEVMIAMGLLGVAILGVLGAQLSALKFTRDSRLRAEAMFLAEQQLEAFQAMSSANVLAAIGDPDYPNDPNNPIDPSPGDGDSTTFTRSWDIAPDDPEADVITISVSVVWVNSLGRSQTMTLRTMKSS